MGKLYQEQALFYRKLAVIQPVVYIIFLILELSLISEVRILKLSP